MIRVPLTRKQGLFYGWVIVASGFIGQVFVSGLGFQGFGTYVVPLEREFGWSKTSLAAARSLTQVESGLVDPVAGFLVDRFGPRLLMMVGSLFFGTGLVLFSRIHSLWAYYGVFLIIALGSSLGGFLAITVTVNNWFRRKRTLAIALTQMGLAFGGMIIIPALVWAQTSHGWRYAALGSGISVWVVGIPLALLMRHSPEKYGTLPDGDSQPQVAQAHIPPASPLPDGDSRDFTLKEALGTPAFWLIGLGHGFSLIVLNAAAVHQFAHMEQGIGISPGEAALVVTVFNAMSLVGRIVGGVLGDRYPKRHLAATGMLSSAVALVVLAFATTYWQAMLFGNAHGFGWGMRGPMMSAMRGEYYGRMAFGKILGVSSMITAPFAIVGPIFAGAMADLQGDYQVGFIILGVVSGVGAICFLLAQPPLLRDSLPAKVRR